MNIRFFRHMLPLLLAATLLAAACGDTDLSADEGDGSGNGDPSETSADVVGAWVLQGGSVNGQALVPVPGYDATLDIAADGSFGGTAACNGYGGSADFADGSVTFGDYSITEMGCEPAPMALEGQFMNGLLLVDRYRLADGDLTLLGDQVEMSFAPVAPVAQAELIGNNWLADTLIDGETASTMMGEPSLRLNEDGSFTGFTGCRTVTGQWLVNGGTLQFPSLSADGDCPPELADQDGFVIEVLEGPATVAIDGPRLTLTSPGEIGLGFRLES